MLQILALVLLHQAFAVVPGLTLREQSASLLYNEAIRTKLALTSEQRRAVGQAIKENDERPVASLASDRRFAGEATKPLTSVQRQALFVRAVKLRGVAAIADPEVAAIVGLKDAALASAKGTVKKMDDRDVALSDELASAAANLPEPKTTEENRAYDAKRADLDRAALPRLKAREAGRRTEERALLASLPVAVRKAWAKLTS